MQKVFGGILMGCGILIAGVSGLCVLILGVGLFSEFGSDMGTEDVISMIPMALTYVGLPIAIGVALIFLGRFVIREANEAEQAANPEDQSDTFK
jgi:TRAP-type C4-dicarboxylate transport system permease small subunit